MAHRPKRLEGSYGLMIPGPGVPVGGMARDVLIKTSSSDYDTHWDHLEWVDIAGSPAANLQLVALINSMAGGEHNHDDRYFTKSQVTALLGDYALEAHDHDTVYAAIDHNHDSDYASIGHDHDGDYQPLNAGLTALAGLTLTGNANRVIKVNGTADGYVLAVDDTGGGSSLTDTDDLSEGSTNLYFTEARVLGTDLAGLADAAGTPAAADTLLVAIGKIKKGFFTDHAGAGGSAHADAVAAGAAGFMTGADKSKLDGIASGATANDTDANLKNRANHTGTQAPATIAMGASDRLVGRDAASAGAATDIAVTDGLAFTGSDAIGMTANQRTRTITYVIDGGGSAISSGLKGFLEIPFACTITGWTILADQSGSIVIDVWKDSYANFPPTVADTIAGTEKPTLSAAQKNQDTALSTWTTSVSAGDILAFNVDSVATVTRVVVSLKVTVTA